MSRHNANIPMILSNEIIQNSNGNKKTEAHS